MFVDEKARAAVRSVVRHAEFVGRRAPRRLRPALISAVGISLMFSLTASARVGATAAADSVRANAASARFPLSVRQISVRKLHGRIVGSATVVNSGSARVRSTTGVLALSRGSGRGTTGVRTFSVASLAPGSSSRVRFTSPPARALKVAAGTYRVLVCADVYSQVGRFEQNTNCSPGPGLAISTVSSARPSGPVPNTIIGTGFARVAKSSTAAFRFVSTVRRSTFQCRLDRGPWLACSPPRTYSAVVDGAHSFDVRAVTRSGEGDPTPARASWTVDTVAPVVTLSRPASGSATNNTRPAFSGVAGTAPGDSSGITVNVFAGRSTSGLPVQTLTATVTGGRWSVAPTRPLAHGTYTAQAQRSDSAGNAGVSMPSTFTINPAPPTQVSPLPGGGSGDPGPSIPTIGSDDFNRANGGLGAGWVPMHDGSLSIVSQQVVGTAGATAGDIRAGETYGSDQFSRIELTSTQLSDGEWIGPTVRSQNGGEDAYLGIYFWNSGSPQLRLYKRTGGTWVQLGDSYHSGPLPAGTQLTLSAVGSRISFQVGGSERIAVTDTTLTGGRPGLMTVGAARGDNWAGGYEGALPPPLQVQYDSTDPNGVASYNVTSADDGYGRHVLRVLAPTNPAPGVPHNFLYVLPVEPGLGTLFGDGLETLRSLDAQDKYNLTIVEPSFGIDPWYADNPNDPNIRFETFMTKDLVPWVTQNLAKTGREQNWLIGFSKSGLGVQDLILKHPDLFAVAASWNFPADMATYDQFGSSSADNYGTDANFQANYRLTPAFVNAHETPFLSKNRIWIGGDDLFPKGPRRLRRAPDLRGNPALDRGARGDASQVGRRVDAGRLKHFESGRGRTCCDSSSSVAAQPSTPARTRVAASSCRNPWRK